MECQNVREWQIQGGLKMDIDAWIEIEIERIRLGE